VLFPQAEYPSMAMMIFFILPNIKFSSHYLNKKIENSGKDSERRMENELKQQLFIIGTFLHFFAGTGMPILFLMS
jgi:hypothetical protein